MYGNCDNESCAAIRYVVDLSVRESVSGENLCAAFRGWEDGEIGVGVDVDIDVEIVYRYVEGMEAWYCANKANIVAVGPEGR